MSRRQSRWTSIYVGAETPGKPYYIRFTPSFMGLEAEGFSHGIAISADHFESDAEAQKWADVLDKFFDAMYRDIVEDHMEKRKLRHTGFYRRNK